MIDNQWSGEPAFLVAGGPSLRSFDFALLRDVPNVLAVNVAFFDVPTAAVMISEDARVFVRFQRELAAFKGVKVFACPDDAYVPEVMAAVPSATIIHTRLKSKGWSKSIAGGLSTSQSSVVPALNLLDVLGANPIYLLGIDCNRSDAGNFHTRYPADWAMGAAQLDSIASDLTHWAAVNLKHRDVRNLNRESAVECWPKTRAPYNEVVQEIVEKLRADMRAPVFAPYGMLKIE
jgi:hypothetical protein